MHLGARGSFQVSGVLLTVFLIYDTVFFRCPDFQLLHRFILFPACALSTYTACNCTSGVVELA